MSTKNSNPSSTKHRRNPGVFSVQPRSYVLSKKDSKTHPFKEEYLFTHYYIFEACFDL